MSDKDGQIRRWGGRERKAESDRFGSGKRNQDRKQPKQAVRLLKR